MENQALAMDETMIFGILLIAYSVVYLIAFLVFGGQYSSRKQEINRCLLLIRTGKYDTERLDEKVQVLHQKAKKIRKFSVGVLCGLLMIHLLLNALTLNEIGFYIYIFISWGFFSFLIILVFLLKGQGTIDANQRMHGGIRI